MRRLSLIGLTGVGAIHAGDDLVQVVLTALAASQQALTEGDTLVLAQKIVSKSEARAVRLSEVTPSPKARSLAVETDKDPHVMELLLRESRTLIRKRSGAVIVEDKRGLVLANAGIDASNVSDDDASVLLLPDNPDASATRLRAGLADATGVAPAVVIVDSLGRAWRRGTTGTAIGVAGMPALLDLRGRPDMFGRPLQSSELGLADELAAAASLVMGQADEQCPIVLVRGLVWSGDGCARDLLRPRELDMFR